MGERIRALWERLKDDFHRNPGLWIGVGISAAILVIAYLAYRRSQGQGLVPANGYGFPNYDTSSGGSDSSGLSYPGYTPFQPASAFPSSPFVPTSSGVTTPATAAPAYPSYQGYTATPAVPSLPFTLSAGVPSGNAADTGAGYVVQGSIQNPLAKSQRAHRGGFPAVAAASPTPTSALPLMTSAQTSGLTASNQLAHRGGFLAALAALAAPTPAPAPAVVNRIQNPTAASDIAHRGTVAPPPPPTTHSVTVPHVSTFIPTTVRPANTGRGRVA